MFTSAFQVLLTRARSHALWLWLWRAHRTEIANGSGNGNGAEVGGSNGLQGSPPVLEDGELSRLLQEAVDQARMRGFLSRTAFENMRVAFQRADKAFRSVLSAQQVLVSTPFLWSMPPTTRSLFICSFMFRLRAIMAFWISHPINVLLFCLIAA